jgi:3-hydroxybutyryl-CoA dehydratase
VLDDPNPIHLDPEAVRALGLGDRVVNQGPANLGYLLDLLHEVAPTGRVADVRVRFMANVLGGDRVIAAGRVEAVEEDAEARRLRCAIWLDVDGGARALEGTATLIVPTTTTPEHD